MPLMKFKLYQMQVAAGYGCAVLLAVLRHGAPSRTGTSLFAMLEAASFGFCCIGIITGGRSLRSKYGALGSSKSAACGDPAYMQERRDMQITAVAACAAVASLLASRYGLNPLYVGLVVPAILAMAVPFINRMTGWSPRP